MSQNLDLESMFEMGQLYRDKGDFQKAIEKLVIARDGFFKLKNYNDYFRCVDLLIRMYAERGQEKEINETKETLQDLVIKEGFELTSKTYYTLGICACYKRQFQVSLDYFQKSLAIALAEDCKTDVCYAINGIAINYYYMDQLSDALKEIYNLQVFFQVLEVPEIKLSSQFINGHILRKLGKYDQALDIFWQCYDVLRETKNMAMYVHLLYGMALTYLDSGDRDMGRMYLSLAKKSVDPKNMVYLARDIDAKLKGLGDAANEKFDLVFKPESNTVLEKKLGKINFKNQFILLDLLRLFVGNPGEVYSKEELVEKVWKQSYNPAVHDNKIYVTIKRLRKLIEPNYDKPKYIFRAKNGYYLNKSVRIFMEQ